MPDIISPVDGQVAYSFELLDLSDALDRLARAETAHRAWRETTVAERVALCRRVLRTYGARGEEYAEQITRMMGKPLSQSRTEFERGARERIAHMCDIAPEALSDEDLPAPEGFRRFIRHEPVGVVLDIAAWNYPLLIAVNVIVPAVLAGNSVLVKHASQTALVADQFERSFVEAGAPPGLVQAYHIDHETVADIVASRRIGYVAFTGSVRGGREVYRTIARNNFIGVGLELGGKDPALVLPDANLDFTVENLVDGAMYNAGQSCCAVERIYVHQDLYERFVEAFVAKVHEYVLGDPLDAATTLGPLVNAEAVEHVRGQVEDALLRGAKLATDPSRFDVPDVSPCYMEPQVLTRVNHGMTIMSEETFGPAIGIMAVRDEDEGVELMNDSHYGLSGSIWTADEYHGIDLAAGVQAGTVYVNRCDYLDPALPWTGVKDSGVGCSLSKFGFLQVTRLKGFYARTAP
jgi:acyl-CoA reductase-like NAD-dependent aldehyde dehydrogenase